MTEMTMIEQVARAMSRGVQNRTVSADLRESEPWQAHREDQIEREWHHYVPFARDACEAMRNPPQKALNCLAVTAVCGGTAGEIWRAALDAALSEQP